MSEPTRYGRKGGDLEPLKDGQFVAWSDYAALKAENERLRSSSFVTAVPSEQYERLRKAGDALIRICEVHKSNVAEYEIRWAVWQNAKEGRDAK